MYRRLCGSQSTFTHLIHANLVRLRLFLNTAFSQLTLHSKHVFLENFTFKGFHCIQAAKSSLLLGQLGCFQFLFRKLHWESLCRNLGSASQIISQSWIPIKGISESKIIKHFKILEKYWIFASLVVFSRGFPCRYFNNTRQCSSNWMVWKDSFRKTVQLT